jgi:hypothetical protein
MDGIMERDLKAYRELDELALQAGTDKASNHHNYTAVYADHFAPLKDKPIKFLEIGIWEGGSVKLWENYFTNAELHFIDATLGGVKYHSQRSHYHIANQESPQDLKEFIEKSGGHFDVIIDDGGHTMKQQITSFVHLFPHINSGGMYIIEDLHTSYWPCLGGGNHCNTTIALLKNLIDKVNFVGAYTAKAAHHQLPQSVLSKLDIYQKDIRGLYFYDSLVFITKW